MLGVQVRLKWPNDLMLNGRKLGGVLLEASQGYVVLGIGLNVNVRLSAFSQDLAPVVTSLEEFLGHPVDLAGLTQEILRQLEEVLTAVQIDPRRLMDQWRDRSMTLGQYVRVTGPAGAFEGVVEDVDDEGVLRVRTEAGVRRVIGADVSVREIREAKP
jgi:BirA family biotin operon repressor/biotin-[acetyl-CoA-carboxylase] ligase